MAEDKLIVMQMLIIVLIVLCPAHADRIYDSDFTLTDYGFACETNIFSDAGLFSCSLIQLSHRATLLH
jgi:hypothetical protein